MHILKMAQLVLNLTWHELRAQRKDTLLGWGWVVLWPILQAAGLLFAVNVLRGNTSIPSIRAMLITYLGVLVWTTSVGVIVSSLGLLQAHRDMILHIRFPFIVLPIVDVTVKFATFLIQLLIGVSLWLWLVPQVAWPLILVYAIVFVVSFYFALVTTAWITSLLGLAVPDLSFILPPAFLLLLTISPVFHLGANLPPAAQYIDTLNPLSFFVSSWYAAIDAQAVGAHVPWTFLLATMCVLPAAYKISTAMYREVGKVL